MMYRNIIFCKPTQRNEVHEIKYLMYSTNKSIYGVFLYYICHNKNEIVCEVNQNLQYQPRYHPNRQLPVHVFSYQTPENILIVFISKTLNALREATSASAMPRGAQTHIRII